MIISHKRKFIFIHIYKTGGTSVTNYFIDSARLVDKLVYKYRISAFLITKLVSILNISDDGLKFFTGFHKHATAAEVKKSSSFFEDYFKFAFVRNPYSHSLSIYRYIKKEQNHPLHSSFGQMPFDQFITAYIKSKPLLQKDHLVNKDGDLIVDYIGKLENIENDIKYLAEFLNAGSSNLSHINKSGDVSSKYWDEFYTDNMKKVVYHYFQEDFEFFDYKP